MLVVVVDFVVEVELDFRLSPTVLLPARYLGIRLGKIAEDGQFEVVASSEDPIRPEPYAASRSPAAWHAFLADLHQRWDGLWANAGR